uniref:UBZ4-type domain-containing protein n=1 Tax=Mola mola TaxID=94237 RepID=A0A3Q3XF02_MOLML
MISSQESLSPSVTSTSCRPQSPVFPRSPDPPGPSGTNEAQAVQSPGHRTSPVFGESGRPQHCLSARKHCLKSSAEELRGPRREEYVYSVVFAHCNSVCVFLNTLLRPSSSSASTGQTPLSGAGEPSGGSTVHYYWGVPFCPRGLDPESYTQVIVAQMEVYEKSLKQAQRCLLRKAEWGEAILPQPEVRHAFKLTHTKLLQETEGNTPGRSSQLGGQVGNDQEVEEDWMELGAEETKDRGLQRSTSPELELLSNPQIPDTSVDCPICQGSFPLTEIEIHAAYCDGDVVVTNRTQPKHDSYQGDRNFDTPSSNMEKCYICQTAVPLRDYSRHKELCLQRHEAKTAAVSRTQEVSGRLFSLPLSQSGCGNIYMIEQETLEALKSTAKSHVIDLRNDDDDDDEDEGDNSAIRISNSPIRSFTPISEATDCLIDFRKQHRPRKPGQKRR